MELKTKYFGLISEITNCSEELVSVPNNCNLSQLESVLKEKYTQLQTISFKIAIDQNIVNFDLTLNPNNEIALLPPFSGG